MADGAPAPGTQNGTEGGGEGGQAQGQQAPAGGAPNPADVAAQAEAARKAQEAAAKDDKGGDKGGEGDDPSDWPEAARKEVQRLRKEAGDSRMNAKRNAAEEARKELLTELTKALDPNAGDETPTPEALLAKVQDTESERDAATVRAALIAEAWKAGVDPDRLDFLEFKVGKRDDFSALKPTEDGWADTLRSMVTDEVAKDGTLKASGAQKGTGDGQYGGSGEQPTITPEAFARMSMQERTDLYRNDRATYDRLVNAQ